MTIAYRPGDAALLAVRGGIAVVVLDATAPAALTPATLWEALALPEPVTHVLEALSASGLAAMPSFAIIDARDAAARAFVRGRLTIEVESGGAADRLDGADVSTWRESVIPSFDLVRIEAGPSGMPSALLALESGVVRMSALELSAGSSSAEPALAVPASAPAPVALEPAPAPATPAVVSPVAEQTLTEPFDSEPAEPAEPAETPGAPARGDGLFEETVVRTPAEAALIGDHDGLTVVGRDIPGFAERERVVPPVASTAPAVPSYIVETDAGQIEPLTGAIVVGRAPVASKVSSGAVPRLIVISDNPDISRTHVRVALEGDTVVVTDLNSRNGTTVRMPGKPPQLLRAGEATPVLDGTVIDLGGTTLAVRSR